MINALVTKNGQSALISLPAKRIGLARDLASIGVASPPSELYPHDDELTVGLKYFGTDDFSDRLITLIQSEDSLARVNTLVELYGKITATLNAPFTEEEQNCFMEWCEGQNSDGFGEGFEQRPIRTVDRSEMYVSFWQSGPDYFLCTENDLDHFIDHGMGEMN